MWTSCFSVRSLWTSSNSCNISAGSKGANGGIAQSAGSSDLAVEAVRLSPFLQSHYSDTFMDNVCFLKVDTEGHDVLILGDLSDHFRPAVVWTEWFREFQFVNFTARVLEVRGSSERSPDLYSDLTMQDLNYCTVQCTVSSHCRISTTAPSSPRSSSGPS